MKSHSHPCILLGMAVACLIGGHLRAQDSPFPDPGQLAGTKVGTIVMEAGRMYQNNADFGLVQVTENSNDPHSHLTPRPFIRHHARRDSAAEPIFILGGGPGKSNLWREMPDVFYAHNEVINVGYRGVDGEVKLKCAEIGTAMAEDSPLSTADQGRVRGTVTDSSNGQPIPYANVVLKGTSLGSSTNSAGFYHILSVPPGTYVLVVSQVGYHTKELTVAVRENQITQTDIQLSLAVIEKGEILIVGERPARPNEANLGLTRISTKEIAMVPPGVEADIFKALQSSPGVTTTSDVSARYYVRGGGSDQNLVLLNGATVYSPFHTLGIFSVVDPEMVSLLEFHEGGFPPSYGGRLSSILNVVTRDGNRKKFQETANATFLAGKIALEGPTPGGSFLVTGRKSWYAAIMKHYLKNQDAPFDFYDLSWKLSYSSPAIDENSRFAFHGFMSGDQVVTDDPFQESYLVRNRIIGLNWHKIWSAPLYSVVSISYSGFDAELTPNLSQAKPRKNRVSDLSADLDFTYLYDSRDEFAFGWQNKILSTSIEMENLFGNSLNLYQHGFDMSAYADYRLYRWERIGFAIGIRFKFVALAEYRPLLYELRGGATYRLTPSILFKGSFGWYSQEMSTLSDESELISVFEPWVITPDYVNSARAAHFSLGMTTYWTSTLTTELEGYYKPIANLLDENEKKFTAKDKDFINVDGESYGLELLTLYQPGKMYAKIGYALSWAYKIKKGMRYFPRYDIRHSLNALVGYELGSGWQASSTWAIHSGMPFTPIAGFYDKESFDPWSPSSGGGKSDPATLWGTKNSARLPTYHRLDLSLTKQFHIEGAKITGGISVINVYDRKNIFYFNRDTGKQTYMLRILPSISLRVEL